MSRLGAFAAGLPRALAAWRVLLLLYLGNLLAAALIAFGLAAGAGDPIGRTVLALLSARPLDLNAAIEIGAAARSNALFGPPPAARGGPIWPAVPLGLLANALLYAYLRGPLIRRLARSPADRAGGSAPEVGIGQGGRWFWPCLRLAILSGFYLFGALMLGLGLTAVSPLAGLAIFALGVSLLEGLFEWARIAIVLRDRRSARAALGVAWGFIRRSPLPAGLLLLLLLLPSAAARLAQSPYGAAPADEPLTALLIGQLGALAGALVKGWRLGSEIDLWERLPAAR